MRRTEPLERKAQDAPSALKGRDRALASRTYAVPAPAALPAPQPTVGLAAPPPAKPSANGKKKKKRKPTVRALRAVERLKDKPSTDPLPVPGEAASIEAQAVVSS